MARCRELSVGILYLTPGLKSGGSEISSALAGTSILTVSAVPEHIHTSCVVAFDLAEGKPEILVHLERARAQQVDFKSQFLRIATVVDR